MVIFNKIQFHLLMFVPILLTLSHVQGSYVQKWDNTEDMRNLWNILEQLPFDEISKVDNVESDYLLEDDEDIRNVQKKQIDYEDVLEKSPKYPNRRAVTYTKCKVVEHHMDNGEDHEFTYLPKHYENVTCEKTDEDPFNITLPHSDQYCYIFHHPSISPSCTTKYRHVSFFRRGRNSELWQRLPQTLAVGCGCTLGFTYGF